MVLFCVFSTIWGGDHNFDKLPHGMYLGLKVVPMSFLWTDVGTIYVRGPLGYWVLEPVGHESYLERQQYQKVIAGSSKSARLP